MQLPLYLKIRILSIQIEEIEEQQEVIIRMEKELMMVTGEE